MATEWKIGDRIESRWEIHKILKGGMGVVYVVYDHEWHDVCAVKTFKDEAFAQNATIADRFNSEAYSWVKLDVHQNVTRAVFVQTISGKPFIFLEYVSGGDLSGWIGTPRLTDDLPQVLRFAIQFCDGMIHVLNKGIAAHRDIKPTNCLITEDKVLKITDFGLAKLTVGMDSDDVQLSGGTQMEKKSGGFLGRLFGRREGSDGGGSPARIDVGFTPSGAVAGTPLYMAPEQFDDVKRVDVRADIYSFGVMLYQMVSGRPPFMGRTQKECERLHKTQLPPELITQNTDLKSLVHASLNKDPAQRFGSFEEVKEKLTKIYQSLTGVPPPPPLTGTELDAMLWNNKCLSLGALMRIPEALVCVERSLELNPSSEHAWTNKGILLRALGKRDEALACHTRALAQNPRFAEAWHNKANVLQDLRRNEEALENYDRALDLDPRIEKAWTSKGNSLVALGQHAQAVACHDCAIRLNPFYEIAWYNKGASLHPLGQYDEEIYCYERALELNPRLAQAWFNKGNTLGKMGRLKEAITSYDRALALKPDFAEALYGKGLALAQLGFQHEALSYFDRVLAVNPRFAEAWSNKGGLLGALGQDEEAIACVDRAIELNPRLAQAWMNKGAALGMIQHHREALACYEEAKQLGHPQAMQAIALCRGLL